MEPSGEDQDQLGRLLDAALHEYGSAGPRMGLEGRLLASLAAERTRATTRRWQVLGAVAAMVCVAVVVWIGEITHRPAVDYVDGRVASMGQRPGAVNGQGDGKRPVVKAARRRLRASVIAVAKEPRLSQFPSPRGLSEQEQLLVRYVTESPSEAVVVAKEQAERQKELARLSGDESSKIDSDQ